MSEEKKEYVNYTRVNWPEVQDLMEESWFYNDAILDNRQGEAMSYLIPTELVDDYYSAKPKDAVIIYSIPEILLDSQIKPAIDMLNTLGVKAHVVNKDSFFKREVRIEIEDRFTNNDLFCLGLIFGRNIKL